MEQIFSCLDSRIDLVLGLSLRKLPAEEARTKEKALAPRLEMLLLKSRHLQFSFFDKIYIYQATCKLLARLGFEPRCAPLINQQNFLQEFIFLALSFFELAQQQLRLKVLYKGVVRPTNSHVVQDILRILAKLTKDLLSQLLLLTKTATILCKPKKQNSQKADTKSEIRLEERVQQYIPAYSHYIRGSNQEVVRTANALFSVLRDRNREIQSRIDNYRRNFYQGDTPVIRYNFRTMVTQDEFKRAKASCFDKRYAKLNRLQDGEDQSFHRLVICYSNNAPVLRLARRAERKDWLQSRSQYLSRTRSSLFASPSQLGRKQQLLTQC